MERKRKLLIECRKSIGTQKSVAPQLGISTVYLRMIENGTFTPGRDLMFRFGELFGRPVEVLFPDYFNK